MRKLIGMFLSVVLLSGAVLPALANSGRPVNFFDDSSISNPIDLKVNCDETSIFDKIQALDEIIVKLEVEILLNERNKVLRRQIEFIISILKLLRDHYQSDVDLLEQLNC